MPLIPTTSRRVYRISRSRRRPTGPVHIPQSPTTRTAWNVTTKHIFSINYQQHCTVIEPLHRFAGPRTRGQVRIPTTHAQIVTHIYQFRAAPPPGMPPLQEPDSDSQLEAMHDTVSSLQPRRHTVVELEPRDLAETHRQADTVRQT